MSTRDPNQRDFYRVDCRVVLSHQLIGDRIPEGKEPESFFSDNEHFNLLRELRRMDQDGSGLLHTIGEQNRNLAAYLTILNRKIDTVARHLATITPEMSRGAEQIVSLSEAGVAFTSPEPLYQGVTIALRMTLLPAWVGLATFARVAKANPTDTGNTRVLVTFEKMQDSDRQIIARHVMQIQMAERKKSSGRTDTF